MVLYAAASVPNVHSGLHTIVSAFLITSCSIPTGRRGRLSTVLMLVLFRVGMTSLLSVDLRVRATACRVCAPWHSTCAFVWLMTLAGAAM